MKPFDYDDLGYLAVELPDEVKYYKFSGDFEGELAAIDRISGKNLPTCLVKRLALEKMIASEMKHDYLLGFDELLAALASRFPAVTADNLRHIMSLGYADFILRGGKPYFQRSAKSNIINCCEEYLKNPLTAAEPVINEFRAENARIMKSRGGRAFRFRVKIGIKPSGKYERPGEILRIHLPFPAVTPEQSEITLLGSSDSVGTDDADQRTAYIETPCVPGKMNFVEFSYINRAIYREPDAERVSPEQPTFFTSEQLPHIRFTPFMRGLAAEIAGDEKNPLRLARRVYEWITENIKYSYMRDYFCIESIAESAALNGRGDCGVQVLVFITLCRILGIPARWQSGCAVRPDSIGSHDWAQFYIAPYGWLYCDPSYGGGALRTGDLGAHEYYFGNLDCFRLVTCRDFQRQFEPPKRFMRCDPYDNQWGEVEYADDGLFFGQTDGYRKLVSAEEIK